MARYYCGNCGEYYFTPNTSCVCGGSPKRKRTFFHKIGVFDFILYASGKCRIDNSESFKTECFEGNDRSKWWELFKQEAEKNKLDANVIDGAFGSWVRLGTKGGARAGSGGKKPKLPDNKKRRKDTITLLPREWDQLDDIGPSRGKAVSKLLSGVVK